MLFFDVSSVFGFDIDWLFHRTPLPQPSLFYLWDFVMKMWSQCDDSLDGWDISGHVRNWLTITKLNEYHVMKCISNIHKDSVDQKVSAFQSTPLYCIKMSQNGECYLERIFLSLCDVRCDVTFHTILQIMWKVFCFFCIVKMTRVIILDTTGYTTARCHCWVHC